MANANSEPSGSSRPVPSDISDQYNDTLCAVERCQALGRAIQHESEDGDEHAALFTLLDRELDSIDKFLEGNPPLSGKANPDAQRDELFECLRRQSHAIINAVDGKIAQSLRDQGPHKALTIELDSLRGWLETIDDKLGVLEGAHEYGTSPAGISSRAATPRTIAETDTERALRALKRAERLLEVCRTSVEALDAEHSAEVAFTMGSELWQALDEARQVLEPDETEEHAQ